MRTFLKDIGFEQKAPTIIYEDNSSAISLASCSNIAKKSRHILLRYHFIKFAVESGHVEVHYVDTKDQRADILTKAANKSQFIAGRSNILNLHDDSTLFPSTNVTEGALGVSAITSTSLAVPSSTFSNSSIINNTLINNKRSYA